MNGKRSGEVGNCFEGPGSVCRVLALVVCSLVCFSALATAQTAGTLKWEYLTPGPQIPSSPAIADDGTVYVTTQWPWPGLYAVNPDGSEKWVHLPGDELWATPAIGADGTIYFGGESQALFFAVNPDGTEKWELDVNGDVLSSAAIGQDGTIYVASENTSDDNFYAINPDGTVRWSLETGFEIESSPAVAPDGTIYVAGEDLEVIAMSPSGSEKWTIDLPGGAGFYGVVSSPAVGFDGAIYIGGGNGNLYALNPDGTLRWFYDTGAKIVSSPAIDSSGTIYVGSWNGVLSAVNPDGSLKWDLALGNQIDSSPAIGADGTVYIATWGGRLQAVGASGTSLWQYSIGGEPLSSPAVGPDGTVYIGGYRYLYAINSDSPGLAQSSWPMYRQNVKRTGRAENLAIPLTLGQPRQVDVAQGEAHVYSVTTEAGRSLLVGVTPNANISGMALYGQQGSLFYQAVSPTSRGTWEIVMDPTVGGEYLLTVIVSDVDAGGGRYTILADYATHHLRDVEPRRGGNVGAVRLRISGLGFETGMAVELRGVATTTLSADEVTVSSSSELLARFDLNGADTGLYDLHVNWPGGPGKTLSNAFTVAPGSGGVLEASLEAPEAVRPNRRYTLWLLYANTGDADLPAPLFTVRSPGALMALNPDQIGSSRVEILGVGDTADPDVLAVGESRRIPIFFVASSGGSVDFELSRTLGGTGAVDWEAQKGSMKPPDMSTAEWNTLWPNLKSRLGVTWDDYLGVLRSDARLLQQRGAREHDVAEMIHLEALQAAGRPAAAIGGLLRHADTLEPLTGILLRLRNDDGSVLRQTETAYSPPGHFLITGVANETYDLLVDGYVLDPPEMVTMTGTDITDLDLLASDVPVSEDTVELEIPQHSPSVVKDATGNQYLVWQQGSEIWWAMDSGSGWNQGGAIPGAVGARPVIAHGSELLNGGLSPGLFVAWETVDSPTMIEWSVGDLSGSTIVWTQPVALTGDNFDDTALAVFLDDLQDPIVLWLQRNLSIEDDTDLYYQSFDLHAALSAKGGFVADPLQAAPAAQVCSSINIRWIELLDPFIPVIGGLYGFSVYGDLCGDHECTLNRSLGGGGAHTLVPIAHEGSTFSGPPADLAGMWETDTCSCQYVFETASLDMTVPIDLNWTSSGVPLYFDEVNEIAPLSALIGTGHLTVFADGDLTGSLSWSSNFPGWWNEGDVSFGLDDQISGVLHSDEGVVSALISGTAWVYWEHTAPPSQFAFTDICLNLQGQAYGGFGTMLEVFSQTWGDCLSAPGQQSLPGTDWNGYSIENLHMAGSVPVDKSLSFVKTPLQGTGASYEGSSVLSDISGDLYNDGPPATAKSASGEMMVVWAKDEPADSLGSRIYAATYSGLDWGAPIELTTQIGFNKDPAMVFDSNGNPMVVWSSASNAGLDYGTDSVTELLAGMQSAEIVFSRRVGSSWTTPQTLASVNGRDEKAALGVGPSGLLTASWLSQSASGWRLWASVWNGGSWLAPAVVAQPALASRPTVVYSGSNPVLIWAQDGDGDPETLDDWTLYTSSRSGSSWSSPKPVDLTTVLPGLSKLATEQALGGIASSPGEPTALSDPPEGCCEDCEAMQPAPPDPPPVVQEPVYEAVSEVVAGIDPNEKVGPLGQGSMHYVLAGDRLDYVVYFENLPTASAPAQEVFVTDCLPKELDRSTLRLTEVAFGDVIAANPGSSMLFEDRVTIADHRSSADLSWWVDIESEFDFMNGCLQVTLRTLDPETGELPADPFAGLLPPEDGSGRGQGHVGFTIDAGSDLVDGTLIANKASIVFDTNAPIVTNTWSNTIGQPAGFFSLRVDRTGSGSGVVVSSLPGIDCGADCSEVYSQGVTVTLSATPDYGSALVGWRGDRDCLDGVVVMNASRSCIAEFGLAIFHGDFEAGDASQWSMASP